MLDVNSVLAAFSEEHVSRITGLSICRLRYGLRRGISGPATLKTIPTFHSAASTRSRT